MNNLQRALLSLHRQPIPDRAVTWLTRHRPSVAFLLCVCSGPWVIQRRRQVQTKALAALGTSDLCALRIRKSLFPLAWQCQILRRAKVLVQTEFPGASFDEVFAKAKSKRLATIDSLAAIASDNKIPKVLWMFVRDFWKEPCFPVDRHVRRWCIANDLPSTSEELTELFKQTTPAFKRQATLQSWARVIFEAKSSNPIFPAQ